MKIRVFDILAVILSLVVFSLFILFGWSRNGGDTYLFVEYNENSALYPLSEDREVYVEGPVGESVIRIEEGYAFFQHSDCPDELCVRMSAISEAGDWAACLPNQIFISISGGRAGDEERVFDN